MELSPVTEGELVAQRLAATAIVRSHRRRLWDVENRWVKMQT